VARISGVKRDLRDRLFAHLKVRGGTFQSQPPDVFAHRLAHHSAKNPMEMEWREARKLRQLVQSERLVQVLLDVHQHPQDSPLVVMQCDWLHPATTALIAYRVPAALDRAC
jgi:hypothetical protein